MTSAVAWTGSARRYTTLRGALLAVLLACALAMPDLQAQEKRRASGAGTGAAIGGFIGLVLGGTLFDAAAGATIGAIGGAAGDAARADSEADQAYDWLQDSAYAVSDAQREQEQLLAEKARLEAEYRRVVEERARLEAKAGGPVPDTDPEPEPAMEDPVAPRVVLEPRPSPNNPEEALGEDNVKGFEALVACQHEEAVVLSRTARLSDSRDHRLAGLWLEALVAADAGATPSLERIIDADMDIQDEDQATEALGQVLAMIDEERENAGISC